MKGKLQWYARGPHEILIRQTPQDDIRVPAQSAHFGK